MFREKVVGISAIGKIYAIFSQNTIDHIRHLKVIDS